MPLSSAQIAQLNGAFTQQHMMNMQYSGMIDHSKYNFGGMNRPEQNEGLAAGAMSTASAVVAPMGMLGLGMMGLDPLQMGIKAGIGGGLGAGLAVGGGLMAGMTAIGYMGNQVMGGAQQGQQFNQGMRSSFTFANTSSATGRGFGGSDIREIGNNLRGMSGGSIGGGGGGFGGVLDQFQLGPSFNELGRLAANMGRMGLADGVRNAKDFTEKFREMLKTVTTISELMGTTLEEAQKMMASMKGSGIFSKQAQVTQAIRQGSVAGGLATTEVTGMMNVGSQISRMFGGTGKQGAMGGIEAISQIGTAQQSGILSEEDVFQATGLYGAEGRRALAQQQLMQTGNFLKSSKGRWFLAAVAGKNGNLDSSSVSDMMTGGMSVGDTRQAARRNLGRIGRADFIRNEGRLRGAVMEQFGGLAPAIGMMGWAQSKGIDLHSMGDREMLFMQRQLGMGRDETDALVKMARKLPDLMQTRRNAKEDDSMMQDRLLRERDSGVEGVKRKLDAARDKVNNEMQRVGQDILNVATDRIAEWGNRLAGVYEERSIRGLREAHRAAGMGGARGRDIMQGLVGGGSFLRDLGGGSHGGLHEDVGQKALREKMQDLQFAARVGTAGSMGGDLRQLVQGQSLELKRAYADELSGLGGEDRMAGFKRRFGKGTALGDRFRGMDEREQASFMQQMEGEIGIKNGRLSETFQVPGLPQLRGHGEFTQAQREESSGRSMLGIERGLGTKALDVATGLAAGTLVGDLVSGRGLRSSAGDLVEEISGRSKMAREAGRFLDDPEMRRIAFDSLSGAAGAEDKLLGAISNARGLAAERGGMDKLSPEERARLGTLEQVRVTADLMKTANARGGIDKMTNADWDKLITKRKRMAEDMGLDPNSVTRESILTQAQGVQGAATAQRREIVEQLASQVGKTSRQESQTLQAGGLAKLVTFKGQGRGVVEELRLTDDAEAALRKSGGAGAVQAARMALGVQGLGMRAGKAHTEAEQRELLLKQQDLEGQLFDMMGGMSVKSLRAIGQQMAGTSVGGQASEMIMRGQALDGSKRRLGAGGAVAAQLGLEFRGDELKGMKGMGAEQAAAAIASRLGVGDDKGFVSGLQEAIAATSKKGGGIQGGALLQRALGQADESTKRKLEEQARGQASPEEKIIDKIGEGNNFLKALVESNKAAKAALDAIRNNTSTPADGEADGGGRRGG